MLAKEGVELEIKVVHRLRPALDADQREARRRQLLPAPAPTSTRSSRSRRTTSRSWSPRPRRAARRLLGQAQGGGGHPRGRDGRDPERPVQLRPRVAADGQERPDHAEGSEQHLGHPEGHRRQPEEAWKIRELEAATLPRVLNQVDLAVINTNYAIEAKLNPVKDSLFIEDRSSPYANSAGARDSTTRPARRSGSCRRRAELARGGSSSADKYQGRGGSSRRSDRSAARDRLRGDGSRRSPAVEGEAGPGCQRDGCEYGRNQRQQSTSATRAQEYMIGRLPVPPASMIGIGGRPVKPEPRKRADGRSADPPAPRRRRGHGHDPRPSRCTAPPHSHRQREES